MRNFIILLCLFIFSSACSKSSKESPRDVPTDDRPAEGQTPSAADAPEEAAPVSSPEEPPGSGSPDEIGVAPQPDPGVNPGGVSPDEPHPVVPSEENPEPAAPEEIVEDRPTVFAVSEVQYWIYEKDGDKLIFNNPWDSEEGDGIQRDAAKLPAYVRACTDDAKGKFEEKMAASQEKVRQLLEAGGSPRVTLLVNVVEMVSERNALRRLDRDAYFWNWPDPKARPYFALANFRKGSFVWEVIAAEDGCVQPDSREVDRYLDHVRARLTSAKGVAKS